MKYHEMIRNGEFKMSYEDKVCSRCFRKDVREYVTFKDYNLCTKCIDNIEKINNTNRPIPIPLVTMKQNIYNIDNNNIYINEINHKFKIIDRISHENFKIIINDKIKILHYKEIIDKYWDCLSFCDKEYIINIDD